MLNDIDIEKYTKNDERIKKPIIIAPKKEKRFFASLIDLLFVIIFGIALFYSCSLPIAKKAMNYSALEEKSLSLRNDMKAMQTEGHIISYNENNEEVTLNDQLKEYLDMKMENTNYDDDGNLKDGIAYYYTAYRKTIFPDDEVMHDIPWFNVNILGLPKDTTATNNSAYWQYATDLDGAKKPNVLGVFREDNKFKANLQGFLNGYMLDDNVNAYSNYKDWFLDAVSDAKEDLGKSAKYKAYYQEYVNQQVNMSWTYTYATLPVYALSLIIFFIIIPLFFKNGCTLGKLILHIGVCQTNGVKLNRFALFFRQFVQSIELLGFFFMVPIFSVGIIFAMTLPIIQLPFGIANGVTLILFSGAILLISFFMMVFSSSGRSLHDVLSQSKVVSTKDTKIFNSEDELNIEISKLNK
jgi:uncharacterized RDD family membrane protein YckC